MFLLSRFTWVGFDLDHTLIRYRMPQLCNLIYHGLCEYLLEHCHGLYDHAGLDRPFEPKFCLKGLVFDRRYGTFFKISEHGHIGPLVTHGTTPLTAAQRNSIYPPDCVFDEWDALRNFERSSRFFYFTTHFDRPAALICARVVDSLTSFTQDNATVPEIDTSSLFRDLFDAFGYNFDPENFALDKGPYFPAIKRDPLHYIYPRTTLHTFLQSHRTAHPSTRIWLMTNSFADYSYLLMDAAFGSNWRDLFDLVVVHAQKPTFFTGTNPFYTLEPHTHTRNATPIASLPPFPAQPQSPPQQRLPVFSAGNQTELERFFEESVESPKDLKVAYVGDNIHSDVVVSHVHANWHTISVVEEITDDCYVSVSSKDPNETHLTIETNHLTSHSAPLERLDDSQWFTSTASIPLTDTIPSPPPNNPFNPDRDDLIAPTYLYSPHWGSFFTNDSPHTGQCATARSHLAATIARYSSISIPCLSLLLLQPDALDQSPFATYAVFDHDHPLSLSGYHPSPPKALLSLTPNILLFQNQANSFETEHISEEPEINIIVAV